MKILIFKLLFAFLYAPQTLLYNMVYIKPRRL